MKYLSLILGFFLTVSAEAGMGIEPYLGVEANYRSMNFKENYGRTDFEGGLMGASGFVGARVGDIALEAGGHITPWSSKSLHEHKISGLFLNVLAFYPIMTNLELVGGLGISHLTFSFVRPQSRVISISGDDSKPPKYSEISDNIAEHYGITKNSFSNFTPRIMIGLQYQIVENIHARMVGSFEVTRRLKHYEIRPKNSSSVHSGLVLTF